MRRSSTLVLGLAALGPLVLAACSDEGPAGPGSGPAQLSFGVDTVDLATDSSATVELTNTGGETARSLTLSATELVEVLTSTGQKGTVVPSPSQIGSLGPGESVDVEIVVEPADGAGPGLYGSQLRVDGADGVGSATPLRFRIPDPRAPGAAEVVIGELPASARQGDVLRLEAAVQDSSGETLAGAPVTWSFEPEGAGIVVDDSVFVGYETGTVRLRASVGGIVDETTLDVTARDVSGSLREVGRGVPPVRFTSDLWVHGDAAYTGTWGGGGSSGRPIGNALLVWDMSDPTAPVLVDSVKVDASTVNDVKVSADGALGVITHERSADRTNGITLLDLSDPLHPEVFTRFTESLARGVHNTWIEGDHVYAVEDGAGGLRVVDVSDPRDPALVATWSAADEAGATVILHDVYVRDGLAFLSYWDAGLIILDVGHGIEGGSPTNPVEVERVKTEDGDTHNAWYWPETGYVFVGEEDFDLGDPGILHVVDARDLRNPREVATYEVDGTLSPPHNFWLDEDRGVLYAAWYSAGVHAIDVTGDLAGELHRQGRTVASIDYADGGAVCQRTDDDSSTCAWAPQLHRGRVFVADMELGLVVLEPGM